MKNTEVELKYHIEYEESETILYQVKRYLSIYDMTEEKLKAVYYDTPNNILLKRQIAFRIRKEGKNTSATVKAHGAYKNGIFSRKEWNMNINDKEVVDIKNILLKIELGESLEEAINNQILVPKVITEFARKKKEIETGECLIELAFDKGEVITECGRERFCELELELLKGSQSCLETFGKDLSLKFKLKPQPVSKYERGLRLLGLI